MPDFDPEREKNSAYIIERIQELAMANELGKLNERPGDIAKVLYRLRRFPELERVVETWETEVKQRYEQRIAAIETEAYGAIAEAARIFELLKQGKPGMEQVTLGDLLLWLESDAVVRARNAAKQKEGG